MTAARPVRAANAPLARPDAPLTRTEFASLMARCGPFEPRPLLAVAVSGGADSLALALLAADWTRARRGRIVALTVDHGLRRDSRAEALQVGRWLRALGIDHRILMWRGTKPRTGLQAAARDARYRLLGDACRRAGVLHLLLGHTRDDQAETVLLRLEAGSGPFGLAAMPAIADTAAVRRLRPFLPVSRARLEATLRARKQDWIDDPSNRNQAFARVRVRGTLAAATDPDGLRAALAASAAALGRFRAAEEQAIADLLARAVTLFPEAYARFDCRVLAAAPPDRGWRALAALLATVGGRDYAPPGEAVRRLFAAMSEGRLGAGRTLARCRLIPDGPFCLVVRELRGIEVTRPAPRPAHWDGRFSIVLPAGTHSGTWIAPLGAEGWAAAVATAPWLRETTVPYPARLALPALWDRRGLAAIPMLGFTRKNPLRRKKTQIGTHLPLRPLAGASFAAWPGRKEPLEPETRPVV